MHKKLLKISVAGCVVLGTLYSSYNYDFSAKNPNEKETHVQAAENKAQAVKLINGDFEEPLMTTTEGWQMIPASTVPGWETTDSLGVIEFQHPGQYAGAHEAAHGNQWVELNADEPATLYQDLPTTPGETVRWQVYHRGKKGIDVANIEFGDPSNPKVQCEMSTDNTAWKLYQGTYTIPAGQTTTRFQFRAVSSEGGDVRNGNLLDNILFATPAQLTLTNSFDKGTIMKNQTSKYSLTLASDGGLPAANNQVTVHLPKEVSYVAGSLTVNGATVSNEQYNAATHEVTFTLSDIVDGSQAVVTLNVKGDQTTTGAQATASVSYQDQGFNDKTYQVSSDATTIVIEAGESPIITGPNVTLNLGSAFDPMKDMKATDKEDGDLTAKIKVVDNPVNVNVPGVYQVKYEVTDAQSNTTTFTRTVTIRSEIKLTNATKNGADDVTTKGAEPTDQLSHQQTITNDSSAPWYVTKIVSHIPAGVDEPQNIVLKVGSKTIPVHSSYDGNTGLLTIDLDDAYALANKEKLILTFDTSVNYSQIGNTVKQYFEVTGMGVKGDDTTAYTEKSSEVSFKISDGHLGFLEVPTDLAFETTKIQSKETVVPREKTDWTIKVKDTRKDKKDWQITAKVDQPLTTADGETLENALIFKKGSKETPLTTTTQLIEDNQQHQEQTDVNWAKDEGTLIKVKQGQALAKKYQTNITWILQDTP